MIRKRSSRRLLSWCLPLFLLSACADMTGIVPQAQMRTPQGIAEAALADVVPPESGEWWAAWADPQLNRLMAQALDGNPTLQVARTRIDQARAVATRVESRTRPALFAGADFQRERFSLNQFFPPPIGGNTYWNNEATLNLSYELDLWGRQESLLAAAVSESRAALAEAWQVRLALATAIAQAYVQLAMQCDLSDIAKEEQQRLENALSIARRRERGGLGAGQEAEGIAAALARQEARVESLDTAATLARHQLAALAGLGPGTGDTIARPRLADAATLNLPPHLPADLVGRRPDVIAQRWRVEAAGHRIESAKASFYPDIDLMAFVGFQALGFMRFLDGDSAIRGVGPALSLPIFDGGRRRGRLALETAIHDEAVDAYNGVLVRALQSVADHAARLAGNRREADLARQALAASRRRQTAAERAWRAGVGPYQAVLEAQAAVLADRDILIRLDAARREDFAGLMLALGGKWPDPAAGSAPTALGRLP